MTLYHIFAVLSSFNYVVEVLLHIDIFSCIQALFVLIKPGNFTGLLLQERYWKKRIDLKRASH